ncbi:hypothetical protein [Hymenobacter sp. DG01]|uniref:hypothetical protein n=1 Tax=Hymenobacter sp. DG01 TaxID=2584940 RepID=UPI0011213530|nr:hypothetical protein [Hymenobacter sp. DG01]
MRLLYVCLAVLLPSACLAQREFTPGSYELLDGTKGEGELKYSSGMGAELILKTNEKKGKSSFSPKQVKSFKVSNRLFVPVYDFELNNGMPLTPKYHIRQDFAEVLDTGRVELLKYTLLVGNMKDKYSRGQYVGLLLIRRRGEQLVSIPLVDKKARPVLSSFVKDRPDIVSFISQEALDEDKIRAIVQEYNSGQIR